MGGGEFPLFSHLDHLSSSKICMISNLLVGFENAVSFSFGFCRNLTNREMIEVTSFISLLEGCCSREGRKDSGGYTCKSLFILLLDPAPLWSRFLMWFGGLWFLRNLGSLFDKSCLVGLTPLTHLLGKLCLLGPFVACFIGRWRKTLIISFGTASLLGYVELFLPRV